MLRICPLPATSSGNHLALQMKCNSYQRGIIILIASQSRLKDDVEGAIKKRAENDAPLFEAITN